MRGIYDGYTLMKTKGERAFFAGGNTESGFVGNYGDIANENELERVYIIKGGPGTGKNTMMRKIAGRVESRGYSAEYYCCGSDPESVDCVVLDGKIAVLDGTAPHVWEMRYPGVKSEIIDVSKYLDKAELEPHKDEIISATAMKSAEYASTYRYMRAASVAETEMLESSLHLLDSDKAEKHIKRFIKSLGKPIGDGKTKNRYTHAVTMKGMFAVDTMMNIGKIRYTVTDVLSVATHFMSMLKDALRKSGFTLTVGLIPLGGHISGIYIHDADVTISVRAREDGIKNINMNRFIIQDVKDTLKGKVRLGAKVRETCISEALSSLKSAAEKHFVLEEIYKTAMDFDSLTSETDTVIADILQKLEKRDD